MAATEWFGLLHPQVGSQVLYIICYLINFAIVQNRCGQSRRPPAQKTGKPAKPLCRQCLAESTQSLSTDLPDKNGD